MARRKISNTFTTISITWKDKEQFRRFAKFVKNTKNGKRYESDAQLFNRILDHYIQSGNDDLSETPNSTYPFQDKSQQSS